MTSAVFGIMIFTTVVNAYIFSQYLEASKNVLAWIDAGRIADGLVTQIE